MDLAADAVRLQLVGQSCGVSEERESRHSNANYAGHHRARVDADAHLAAAAAEAAAAELLVSRPPVKTVGASSFWRRVNSAAELAARNDGGDTGDGRLTEATREGERRAKLIDRVGAARLSPSIGLIGGAGAY